jgi:nucleoside-diphosphate-sugar epimerase
MAVATAWSRHTPPDPVMVYAASKTEGERTAWKWVKENQPGFVFNTVLPNWLVNALLLLI